MFENQQGFTNIQIILSVLAGTIILGGVVGGVLYFNSSKKPAPEEPELEHRVSPPQGRTEKVNRCGDSICDAAEKTNPNLCPKDCEIAPTTPPDSKLPESPDDSQKPKQPGFPIKEPNDASSSKDSPFGLSAVFGLEYPNFIKDMSFNDEDYWKWTGDHLKNLGVNWSRGGEKIIWDLVEPELGNGYDWSESDKILRAAYKNTDSKFNMIVVISPAIKRTGSADIDKSEEESFKNFVKAAVERYDGDGVNDYDSNIKVKYWQAYNEPFPIAWQQKNGSNDGYIRFLELIYEAIEWADPEARIVFGTQILKPGNDNDFSSIEYIFSKLKNKKIFDFLDVHYWSSFTEYKVPQIDKIRNLLDSNGYESMKIILTEHGTWANQPSGFIKQTEKDQALYLVKSFVYNLSNEISLIYWNNLVEWDMYAGNPNSMFNYMGLISDGKNGDELNKKRLSYYTYKKLIGTLNGSNFDNVQKIQESGGVYVYKFPRQGKDVWVMWNDNSGSKQITLSGINSSSIKITEAVPNYSSGKEVTNYNTAFKTETKTVSNDKVMITLGDTPVFVEEN